MASLVRTVSDGDTAAALGSGDVVVLGTPRLLAWMEAATVAEAASLLAAGETSVGTRVELDHLAASPVGAVLTVTATLGHRDGRLLRFVVGAQDADGRAVASATVTRVVMDRERFLARLPAP